MAQRDGRGGRAIVPVTISNSPLSDRDLERRKGARLETDYNGACIIGAVTYNVEISDFSDTGARLTVRQGVVPGVGKRIALGLMNGRTIEGIVVRSDGREIGLQFDEPIADVDDLLHHDEMGARFYSAVLKLQISRD